MQCIAYSLGSSLRTASLTTLPGALDLSTFADTAFITSPIIFFPDDPSCRSCSTTCLTTDSSSWTDICSGNSFWMMPTSRSSFSARSSRAGLAARNWRDDSCRLAMAFCKMLETSVAPALPALAAYCCSERSDCEA